MAQYDYSLPTVGLPGQLVHPFGPNLIDSFVWPQVAQVVTVSVGATPPDGTYTVRISGREGIFDFSFVAASSTQQQIADGLVAAAKAVLGLNGVVVPASGTNAFTLTFQVGAPLYTISFPSNPSSKLTQTLTTDPAVGNVLPGLAVVDNAYNTIRRPTTGDTAIKIAGVALRSQGDLAPLSRVVLADAFLPGAVVPVLARGDVWVDVEDAVAYKGTANVRITANGALTTLGAFRSDTDSGNAIAIRGHYLFATTGAGRTKLRLMLPSTV